MDRYHKGFRVLAYIVLIIFSLLAVLPFVLMISGAFTDEMSAIRDGFSFIPRVFSLGAFKYVFGSWKLFGRAYLITIIVTVVGVLLCILLTLTLGYALSRKGLPGQKVLTFLIIFTMLFNGGLVATYISYTQIFGIKNTLWAMIIPNMVTNAFFIVMVKNYFQNSIPDALFEAAKIDGASEIRLFTRIAVPLAKPIIATLALMSGVAYWNDWQNCLYYIDNQKLYGIQNVLIAISNSVTYLASGGGTASGRIPTETSRMAVAIIAVLPILIAYPFFQEYFVKGITMGGVKE